MGYDGKPIGPDLTIVPVVLQYGVFPSALRVCGYLIDRGPAAPCLIMVIGLQVPVIQDVY